VQWAVGQGGFWTTSGTYRPTGGSPERSFEIVFDCGSSTSGGLTRALNKYRPVDGHIDFLFLSHFDLDHTSGIDQLLRRFKIDTVVMPLLSPAATLLTASRLTARASLTGEQLQLLTNPGTYLRERNVQRVVLLQPAPENEGFEGPAAPTPDQPPSPIDTEARALSGARAEIIEPDLVTVGASDLFPGVDIASHRTTFWLTAQDHQAFWQLSPYVHPFEPLRIGTFMQAAYRLLDAAGGDVRTAIQTVLTSRNRRRDLKSLYHLVRSDHNAVSLSLFSCPCMSTESSQMWLNLPPATGGIGLMQCSPPRFGWMHTGDSTLRTNVYRRAWLSYYRRAFDHVGMLVVPHHGSKHNFHTELLSVCKPAVAIACAGRNNTFRHPEPSVARSAKAHASAFHQVDEHAINELVSVYWS
jgi:hypothetical protein